MRLLLPVSATVPKLSIVRSSQVLEEGATPRVAPAATSVLPVPVIVPPVQTRLLKLAAPLPARVPPLRLAVPATPPVPLKLIAPPLIVSVPVSWDVPAMDRARPENSRASPQFRLLMESLPWEWVTVIAESGLIVTSSAGPGKAGLQFQFALTSQSPLAPGDPRHRRRAERRPAGNDGHRNCQGQSPPPAQLPPPSHGCDLSVCHGTTPLWFALITSPGQTIGVVSPCQ